MNVTWFLGIEICMIILCCIIIAYGGMEDRMVTLWCVTETLLFHIFDNLLIISPIHCKMASLLQNPQRQA